MTTNLVRLNNLLQAENVPAFRKTVSPSMNNMAWLRKTLGSNPDTGQELRTLLAMDPKTLLSQSHAENRTA